MKTILAFLVACLTASMASAATICVTPASGCGSSQSTVQAAVNAAAAGDTIKLAAGTTYTESITLPNKGVLASYITITTDASAGSLPAANVRTGPSYVAFMPKIQSPGGGVSAIYFAAGANHYKFTHINFLWVPQGFGEIVSFGAGDFSQIYESQEPTDAIFDQVYVLGDPVAGQKRAFGVNGKRFTLTNSYIARIHSVGQDSQCVQGTNGHGPIDIENNYLECATENFILGGGDPAIRTWMHVASPTTTSATVTAYESGHTLAELNVGQFIAIQTVAGTPTYNSLQFATISTITGTGTTGSITWSPATTVTPVVGGDIRAQVVTDGITFRRNYVTKDPNWFLGVLLAPASPTATGSTASGTLAAGQYCYKVQAFSLNGYQGNPVNSALATEQCATIAATGKVTVAFSAVSGATSYRIWRGTSANGENQFTSVTALSNVDDGTLVYTSGTPFGATQVDTKNLFELKCATNVQVDSNIFIHHKRGSDIGYSLWLKTVNQDGNGWACQTKNVTIEKNIWSDLNGWMEVHGQEASGNPFPGPLTNLTVRNNLVYGSTYTNGGDIYSFNISQAATNVTIDHNTVINVTDGNGGGLLVVDSTQAALSGFVFQNNMVRSETYGIHDPAGSGDAALALAAPGFVFRNNGVAGGAAPPYTTGNGNVYSNLATWQAAFTTYTDDGSGGANYTIVGGAPGANYRATGSDGLDIGANIALVNTATTGVTTGTGSSVAITLATLPTGVRTVAYSATETASGGTAPYTFAVTSGAAPAGLSLASNGVWTGTPTTTAPYTFTVTVTDNVSATGTQTYTVSILDPVSISTSSPLPSATLSTAYSTTIAFAGGQAPYVCTVSLGTLPTGLSLGSSTCAITGTPTVPGLSTFSILVTGALGSSSTLVGATLTVASEVLPAGRPIQVGPIFHEAQVFRRTTAPANPTDRVVIGDLWLNTAASPPALNIATSSVPAWSPVSSGVSLSTDGSLLTNLNASQLTSGTIPAAAFPASLTISASATVPTANAATVNVTSVEDFADTNCNTLSLSGHSRLCQDVASHTLQLSQNGGAYAALGSAGGGSVPTALSTADGTVTVQVSTTDNANPVGMGESTSNGRSFMFSSLQGLQWQLCRMHDATASTDYVFGCAVSNNTGSTYTWPFKIRQDGVLNFGHTGLIVNGVTAAAGNGFPLLVGKTGLLATQGANIAVTTLYAVPSTGAGLYRVCGNSAVTRAATTSSTMPAVTISWNNGTAQTTTLLASNTGNTLTSYQLSCITVRMAASQNLSYDAGTTVNAYASVGGTSMQYELTLTVEYLN